MSESTSIRIPQCVINRRSEWLQWIAELDKAIPTAITVERLEEIFPQLEFNTTHVTGWSIEVGINGHISKAEMNQIIHWLGNHGWKLNQYRKPGELCQITGKIQYFFEHSDRNSGIAKLEIYTYLADNANCHKVKIGTQTVPVYEVRCT